jgi:hypothetical protein
VTGAILSHLASDDEQTRQAGADTARALIADDATRIMTLGPPLAARVPGEDAGYAGTIIRPGPPFTRSRKSGVASRS